MTDRDAAVLFAVALEGALDQWGHLPLCLGVYDHPSCDSDACRRVREAVATARRLGYLAVREEVEV